MKKAKKVTALVLCAILLVVGSVTGTMAYLTSNDSVTNTFTVGKVNITLDETDVDVYGVKDGDTRVKANAYKLIPGHTYVKDPTVTVTEGSEQAYVRMLVTITDFEDVKDVFGDDFLPQNFVDGWDSSFWVSTNIVKEDNVNNTATYEFRYKEAVDARNSEVKLDALFDTFKMPGNVSGEDLATLEPVEENGQVIEKGMQINVVAHAIQADGFEAKDGKTAEQLAWEAFDGQMTSN